jgi:hypothetical protein
VPIGCTNRIRADISLLDVGRRSELRGAPDSEDCGVPSLRDMCLPPAAGAPVDCAASSLNRASPALLLCRRHRCRASNGLFDTGQRPQLPCRRETPQGCGQGSKQAPISQVLRAPNFDLVAEDLLDPPGAGPFGGGFRSVQCLEELYPPGSPRAMLLRPWDAFFAIFSLLTSVSFQHVQDTSYDFKVFNLLPS